MMHQSRDQMKMRKYAEKHRVASSSKQIKLIYTTHSTRAEDLCLSSISTVPMVKRNTMLIILNRSIDAGCTSERLLHHWLRTGASSKVRVPANWGKMNRTSSKVMVGDRVER